MRSFDTSRSMRTISVSLSLGRERTAWGNELSLPFEQASDNNQLAAAMLFIGRKEAAQAQVWSIETECELASKPLEHWS
jgi:hypothetical protein